MRPSVLSAVLAAVLSGCISRGGSMAPAAHPRVGICDSTAGAADTLRLGAVHAGESLVENVDIINCGAAPVAVERTDCGCACLRTEFDYAPLMPGESRVMRIIFDTYGLSGDVARRVDIYRVGCDVPYRIWIEAQVR